MENRLTIEQCIFQILEIMRQRNFSNGTINIYTHHYNQLRSIAANITSFISVIRSAWNF